MFGLLATKVDRKWCSMTLCGNGKRILEFYSRKYNGNNVTKSWPYMKLFHMWSSTFVCWNFLSSHDLYGVSSGPVPSSHVSVYNKHTGAISQTWLHIQQAVTAPATLISRYSLYMLWVPLRESYLNQIPMFLIFMGLLSDTCHPNMLSGDLLLH